MQLNLIQIGDFIRDLRRGADMTQAELGETLGVSAQSVSNWERGESLPDVSLLPDLARALHCSVDAILLGGEGCLAGRRRVSVADMRDALNCINRMGELLGRDHFMYRCVVEALDTRMNTTLEPAFTDPHILEVFVCECLLECLRNGDTLDPRDVEANLRPSRARDAVLQAIRESGAR